MWQQLLEQIRKGDMRSLARAISMIENEQEGNLQLLENLRPGSPAVIIGVTGPPGAGKSTLVDGLIGEMIKEGKKIAVLCVDPSSPFLMGAVLGDRIRMSQWYNHPSVYIRSLATRGSMGGLHPKIIEITDLVKESGFDYIIVETVGVGQSEIEIAGLADITVVVMVPEAGDEIQTMKAGLMEIADVFVVNKTDRPDADAFVKNLRLMLAPAFHTHKNEIPVIKTIAHRQTGLHELFLALKAHKKETGFQEKKAWLLTEKAWHLLQKEKMKGIDKARLKQMVEDRLVKGELNLYQLIQEYK